MIKNFKITYLEEDSRIDKWLKRKFSSLTQSFVEKNLRKGLIKINNRKIKANYKIIKNDVVNIINYSKDDYRHLVKKPFFDKIPSKIISQFNKSIIFENRDFMIINKWSNIATQGDGKTDISIDDIIKTISINYNLVHRLDKETSGLLIISKNLKITKLFGKMFKEQKITKIYAAICQGKPKHLNSVVKLEIKNKKNDNTSSQSITKYKVLLNNNKFSFILFNPLTGKTHQLRIVAKHLGCPIMGDKKYNAQKTNISEKLKLNAYFLKFNINKQHHIFKAELPKHFNIFFLRQEINKIIDNNIDHFL